MTRPARPASAPILRTILPAGWAVLLALSVAAGPAHGAPAADVPSAALARLPIGTPSLAVAAFDSISSSWGVACVSPELAVGARCVDASSSFGALLSLGPGPGAFRTAASALAAGADADSALGLVAPVGTDPGARLSLVVDRQGFAAAQAGTRLPGVVGARAGRRAATAGMAMRSGLTVVTMADAFDRATGDLGARLLAALQAGERAEGDPFAARGQDASAALLVVRAGAEPGSGSDRLVDLRIDMDSDPVGALARLYARHAETFLPAARVRYGDEAKRRGDDAAAAREYAAAEAGFRAAVARQPKNGDALNELAWFLATRGGDPNEALRFAEAAVVAHPDDPNVADTLAEAAYRAGNLERAIEAAEHAVRLARGNERYAERLRAFRAARAALAPPTR